MKRCAETAVTAVTSVAAVPAVVTVTVVTAVTAVAAVAAVTAVTAALDVRALTVAPRTGLREVGPARTAGPCERVCVGGVGHVATAASDRVNVGSGAGSAPRSRLE